MYSSQEYPHGCETILRGAIFMLEVNILNTENNEMILYAVAMLMENEQLHFDN